MLESDLVNTCRLAAEAMSVYVEWIGQRKARGSGTTVGAPDGILYCNGHVVPLEFKRAKDLDGTPAGKLSIGQIVAAERRMAQGIETHVVDCLEDFVAAVNGCRRRERV